MLPITRRYTNHPITLTLTERCHVCVCMCERTDDLSRYLDCNSRVCVCVCAGVLKAGMERGAKNGAYVLTLVSEHIPQAANAKSLD